MILTIDTSNKHTVTTAIETSMFSIGSMIIYGTIRQRTIWWSKRLKHTVMRTKKIDKITGITMDGKFISNPFDDEN